MQQRRPRLGDILDDYCPRERRLTNHAVVAMIGGDIKQTRCTTCDADHAYKHAKIPRQRRKTEPALSALVATAPKRVVPESMSAEAAGDLEDQMPGGGVEEVLAIEASVGQMPGAAADDLEAAGAGRPTEEGPVHRPLIRAQLPRTEGQPPASRPAPDFTIRQPAGRQNRFGSRHQRGGAAFQGQGNRQHGAGQGNGNVAGNPRGGAPRPTGGRPPMMSRLARRQGPGGKRFK